MPKPTLRLAAALAAILVAVTGLLAAAMLAHPSLGERLREELPEAASDDGAALGSVTVSVDAEARGRPISPLIYGVSVAPPEVVRELGATLDRWGGDPNSRYNWVNGHAWNSGRDYRFQNYGGQSGSAADQFVAGALAAHAQPLITIPMLGWVAKDADPDHRSQGVPATGGPPLSPSSDAIAGYDPAANRALTSVRSLPRKPGPLLDHPDASSPVVYQDEWVHHLVDTFGSGGVRYFAMGNEPDLWAETHTDVHPVRMGYDDMLGVFEDYATAVKAQDPRAQILGPAVSGWTGYFYSDLDRGEDGFATHADRQRHGGEAFLPWWLRQVARADAARGSRTLDYLDVHYYPQAPSVYSDKADPNTRALRIRSVRSLYDPTYRDQSWIDDHIDLIPRLEGWIHQGYPGTKLAVTEYSWGGERDASGAVALAEVLGTFGREGVDLASYWTYPPLDSPAGAAFRLFRNCDGAGGTFGDLSIGAASSAAPVVAYAARHSDTDEVDVIVVNESQDRPATVRLALHGASGSAELFRLDAGSAAIKRSALDGAATPFALGPLSLAMVRVTPGERSPKLLSDGPGPGS